MPKYIHISKLDAAKRQLEIAITLFLTNSDIVATHSLSADAHNLLRDLCKKQSIESFVKDEFIKMIKKEKQKEFKIKINEARNFFKHADRDAERLLKFYVGTTEYLIWDAYIMYYKITKERPPLMQVFYLWFCVKHPDVVIVRDDLKIEIEQLKIDFDPENKTQFLEFLPYACKAMVQLKN